MSTTSGRSRGASRDRLAPVGGLAHDRRSSRRRRGSCEADAHEVLVVGDEHRGHRAAAVERQRGADDEPAVRRAPAVERAAADARPARACRRARGRRRRRSAASPRGSALRTSSATPPGSRATRDGGRRACVAQHVGQRLLHEAVGGEVDTRRQAAAVALHPHVDLEAGAAGLLDELVEHGRGPAAASRRRPRRGRAAGPAGGAAPPAPGGPSRRSPRTLRRRAWAPRRWPAPTRPG